MPRQQPPGVVILPDGAAQTLRHGLGLSAGEAPRISYLSVASEKMRTLEAWQRFGADPKALKATFAPMFFDLVAQFEAQGQVFSQGDEGSAGPIRVDRVPRLDFGGRLRAWRSQRAQVAAMAAHLDRFDPHIVVVSSSTPYIGWARLTRGRRAVFYGHNALWPLTAEPGWLWTRRWRRAAGLFQATLFASDAVAVQGRRVFGPDMPSRVAVPQVLTRPEARNRSACRSLLYLGAIAENRGVFQLCDAVEALRQSHPDLTLHLIGDGPDVPRLHARLGAGIGFERGLGADRLGAALERADLLVQSSFPDRHEGWAEFAAEAAAFGVPLLLSDAVPSPGFAGQALCRVPANDPAALQTALARLVGDDAAFAALCAGYGPERAAVWDRAQSWGSQLGALLLTLPPR